MYSWSRRFMPGRESHIGSVGRRRAVRTGVAGLALTVAATVVLPLAGGVSDADAEPLIPPNSLTMEGIPFDSELAAAVRMLKAAGVDQMAMQAAQAVLDATGKLSPQDIVDRVGQLPLSSAARTRPVATTDPTALLKALGIQTLTPSVAPFCATPTADNPLGLVTGGAGAVAGPWPMKQDPLQQLAPILTLIPGVKLPEKLNLVDKGETAYAFVPATTTSGTGGKMQVAWFNTTTLQGGFADLAPVTDKRTLTVLPLLSGVRLAPVKTGSGTILSAVFGTAQVGSATCVFLPAVGVVTA
ncbi:hypothetical protein [Gordonia bronchialis]|uniref:hypothetical protein n=1 Tax=Gordonia bronchialis TaxID=2054 RepID=UPI00242C079E|nr:hypothetical protein [Gordonia bronchialis]